MELRFKALFMYTHVYNNLFNTNEFFYTYILQEIILHIVEKFNYYFCFSQEQQTAEQIISIFSINLLIKDLFTPS